MLIEKILLDSEVLSPAKGPVQNHMLSDIKFDKPDSMVWTTLGYENTKTGFFL
jgi:hypothetical protein